MLQSPTNLEPSLEPSSAPDDLIVAAEFHEPADSPDSPEPTFELLRGPWFPMFGDTPLYEPAI